VQQNCAQCWDKFLDWGMRTALVVDFHAATKPRLLSLNILYPVKAQDEQNGGKRYIEDRCGKTLRDARARRKGDPNA